MPSVSTIRTWSASGQSAMLVLRLNPSAFRSGSSIRSMASAFAYLLPVCGLVAARRTGTMTACSRLNASANSRRAASAAMDRPRSNRRSSLSTSMPLSRSASLRMAARASPGFVGASACVVMS